MTTFRKRPVEVTAEEFVVGRTSLVDWSIRFIPGTNRYEISTANGWSEITEGVMLVRDKTSGDTWPVKPEIFAETYDEVLPPPLDAPGYREANV